MGTATPIEMTACTVTTAGNGLQVKINLEEADPAGSVQLEQRIPLTTLVSVQVAQIQALQQAARTIERTLAQLLPPATSHMPHTPG